jgi:hypothetical protein
MWIQILLHMEFEVHNKKKKSWCDNSRVKYLSYNLVFHGRMKHIEVDYYFVQEKIVANLFHIFRRLGDRWVHKTSCYATTRKL